MTTEERLEKLENKLSATEGALRRTRHMLGVGALVVLGGLTMAAVQDRQIIRAKGFILLDAQGRERAGLQMDNKGLEPSLYLSDENGIAHATISVFSDGAILRLSDPEDKKVGENGDVSTELMMLDGAPILRLADENAEGRVVINVSSDGPHIMLNNENGNTIWDAATAAASTASPGATAWEAVSEAAAAASRDASTAAESAGGGILDKQAAWDSSSRAWAAVGQAADAAARP